MPIYKGNRANPTAIYFGNKSISKVYVGSRLVWQKPTGLNEFIFTVTVGANTITLPLLDGYTYNCTVDWGDGSPLGTITAYNDADATHTYLAGTYDIKINGTCQSFYCVEESPIYITEIKQWGNCDFRELSFSNNYNLTTIPNSPITGITSSTILNRLFQETGISTIPLGLFDNCIDILDLSDCFVFCASLTSIPSGLFDKCTQVNNLNSCFAGCTSLTSIPSGLFDNCTLVNYFNDTFGGCTSLTSIPSGLFDNCMQVLDFSDCFRNCILLDGNAPELWLRDPEPTGSDCFFNCPELDNYASIPADWK